MIAIELMLKDNHQFESEQNGFELKFSTRKEDNNMLNSPKQLMLHALAGCTGYDMVDLLQKMRVDFDEFKIIVEAEQTEDHPKTYHTVHVIYQFTGKNIDRDKVHRAVELSEEKYCGVSAMFRKFSKVSWEIIYL